METTTATMVQKINLNTPEFVAWMAACQELVDTQLRAGSPDYYADREHTHVLSAEAGGKFIRIVSFNGSQRSSWAFVAREDTTSKALGMVKRGDVHKCASWKAPAKHARGSILNGGTGGVTQWTGPSYIR